MWKYYVLRLTYLFLHRLPAPLLYGVARIVGDVTYYVRPKARRSVTANMWQVMGPNARQGEIRRNARHGFRNVTLYYADLMRIPRLDVQRFAKEQMDLEGLEYLIEARDSGRGAVVVGAHFGSPEMSVQAVAAYGVHLIGLTEPLEPQALADFIHSLRSQHGHLYRPATFGGLKEIMRAIKRGGLIAVLFDRDVSDTGVPMQFFGAEARIPLGGVDLALRTGADLIPSRSWRTPGYSFRIRIGPPIVPVRTGDFKADVRAATAQVLAVLEEQIRSDPGQWTVLDPIWNSEDPPKDEPTGAVQ